MTREACLQIEKLEQKAEAQAGGAALLADQGQSSSKVTARVALANQVIGELDLVFPGLDACFKDVLRAKAGRLIVSDIGDPDRVRRQGVEGLRRFVARRGVALSTPKATEVVEAARVALRLPAAERTALGRVLSADVALLAALEAEIVTAEGALAEVLGHTPAGILQSLPGIAVVRASNYGAGIAILPGSPTPRLPTGPPGLSPPCMSPPDAPVLASASPGRDPSSCARPSSSSAGACPSTTPISRPTASDCSTMARSPAVAAVAVGHRAHRLAFAMLRDQSPYDAAKWAKSVAAGRTAMAKTLRTRQNDVTCPPPATSLAQGGEADKNHNKNAAGRRARG